MMFKRSKIVTRADRARLADELADIRMAVIGTERACCCPAKPLFRVVMPAIAGRPEPVDLLLCGHHYRAGKATLESAGAAVYDGRGVLVLGRHSQRRPRRHETAVAA